MMVKEQDLAAAVVEWLQAMPDYEVYQEVLCGGPVADIVAVHGPASWVIECKTSFTLGLLEQATRWTQGISNYVSIATPRAARFTNDGFKVELLKHYGIGWIQVGNQGSYDTSERLRAPFHRTYPPSTDGSFTADGTYLSSKGLRQRYGATPITHVVHDGHKTGAAAGSANGGHWTPFRQTCAEVMRFVSESPGCSLKDLIDNISHHYASASTARSSIPEWIRRGVIKGVRMETTNGNLALFPEVDDPESNGPGTER